MHIAKGLGHWRTLAFYSERNEQPVEDTAETVKHSCVHCEADGLPGGSQTTGRHPVLLPDRNVAPSSHLGDAVTPNFHSKAPREENVFRVPASPPSRERGLAPRPDPGQSSNPDSSILHTKWPGRQFMLVQISPSPLNSGLFIYLSKVW